MPVHSLETIDDPLLTESCESFAGGQNSFIRPSLLPETQAALLEDVIILLNGQLRKRPGTRNIFPGFVDVENQIVQALVNYKTTTFDALVAFAGGRAWQFNGLDWLLYFDAEIDDHDERIDVVQMTDDIFWTDSGETGISMWDGASAFVVTGSPIATILESISNRLAAAGVAEIPDAVYFSDILDGEGWDLVNNQIRIGAGDGTAITALKTWQESNLLVFKEKGVWLVACDPTASNASDFTIATIHNTIGCVARRSVCQVAQDIWFLSRNGVMSVQKQIATSNNMIAVPVSQPIHNIIQSIRWEHAHKSCACCYNNYYLLSVPVDSDEPDTVIAYHYQMGGFTIFKNWQASVFLEQPFQGTTRLLMGCATGEVREWLDYLRDEELEPTLDFKDGLQGLPLPQTLPFFFPLGRDTVSRVVTRALRFGDQMAQKGGWYGEIEFNHTDGRVELRAILDGVTTPVIRSYVSAASAFTLPFTLPATLPDRPGWALKKFPLHQFPHFREIQMLITSDQGEFNMRRVAITSMMDAYDTREEE
jgi:hypothetical protein